MTAGRTRGWPWFRRLPGPAQVVLWVLVCPLPLALWGFSRPREQRLGPVLVAGCALVVWVSLPFAIADAQRPGPRRAAGPDGPAVTSPPPASPVTAATTTALEPAALPPSTSAVPPTTAVTTLPAPELTSTPTTGEIPPVTTITRPVAAEHGAFLALLPIAPEGARAGYSRSLFADWGDADHDGCDGRDEVLIVESLSPSPVGAGCSFSGQWYSVYDGVTTTDPSTFDIDHMVPLAEAWDSGAAGWDPARRRAYANDLDHPEALIAVSASSNRSKGDRDPAEWGPPRQEYRCQYATDWVTVKVAWGLTADQAEVAALQAMFATC